MRFLTFGVAYWFLEVPSLLEPDRLLEVRFRHRFRHRSHHFRTAHRTISLAAAPACIFDRHHILSRPSDGQVSLQGFCAYLLLMC